MVGVLFRAVFNPEFRCLCLIGNPTRPGLGVGFGQVPFQTIPTQLALLVGCCLPSLSQHLLVIGVCATPDFELRKIGALAVSGTKPVSLVTIISSS